MRIDGYRLLEEEKYRKIKKTPSVEALQSRIPPKLEQEKRKRGKSDKQEKRETFAEMLKRMAENPEKAKELAPPRVYPDSQPRQDRVEIKGRKEEGKERE